ncbi:unnamed protein product [Lampetra fluviatilis]
MVAPLVSAVNSLTSAPPRFLGSQFDARSVTGWRHRPARGGRSPLVSALAIGRTRLPSTGTWLGAPGGAAVAVVGSLRDEHARPPSISDHGKLPWLVAPSVQGLLITRSLSLTTQCCTAELLQKVKPPPLHAEAAREPPEGAAGTRTQARGVFEEEEGGGKSKRGAASLRRFTGPHSAPSSAAALQRYRRQSAVPRPSGARHLMPSSLLGPRFPACPRTGSGGGQNGHGVGAGGEIGRSGAGGGGRSCAGWRAAGGVRIGLVEGRLREQLAAAAAEAGAASRVSRASRVSGGEASSRAAQVTRLAVPRPCEPTAPGRVPSAASCRWPVAPRDSA